MTEEDICKELRIGQSTWARYKQDHKELREAIKSGRRELVIELKNSLIQKAKGYTYEEVKEIEELDEHGNMVVVRREITKKYASPDVAALNLLLKNYDRDHWANDPQALALKKKELELKERHLEAVEW
jgi:hypothetical protein